MVEYDMNELMSTWKEKSNDEYVKVMNRIEILTTKEVKNCSISADGGGKIENVQIESNWKAYKELKKPCT